MISRDAMKIESNSIKNFFHLQKYKIDFVKNNPDYFHPDGLVCFVGQQGSGKTLSAVNYVYQLLELYPKAILVTNLHLTDYPFDNKRVFPFVNGDDFKKYNNGQYGVIFLIDEIQLYFNSLQSKNINPEVMQQISQQRKQRKHIIGTSQIFGRMAKPLREQFSCVVDCKCYFKTIQKLSVVDRDSIDDTTDTQKMTGKVLFNSWYVHSPEFYKRYDTYYVIDTDFASGEDYAKFNGNNNI